MGKLKQVFGKFTNKWNIFMFSFIEKDEHINLLEY